jgi:alkanesulfonate monooxygenase SsuD/methylene tetrahydromethanopterin reductase-like flavin-dependent oxidoreductase (luciferase family)
MWDAWEAGDRRAALAAVPDEVVDALVVHGGPEECRRHVERYRDNGVTVPVLQVVTAAADLGASLRGLVPTS